MIQNVEQAKAYLTKQYEDRHGKQPTTDQLVDFCLLEWADLQTPKNGKATRRGRITK